MIDTFIGNMFWFGFSKYFNMDGISMQCHYRLKLLLDDSSNGSGLVAQQMLITSDCQNFTPVISRLITSETYELGGYLSNASLEDSVFRLGIPLQICDTEQFDTVSTSYERVSVNINSTNDGSVYEIDLINKSLATVISSSSNNNQSAVLDVPHEQCTNAHVLHKNKEVFMNDVTLPSPSCISHLSLNYKANSWKLQSSTDDLFCDLSSMSEHQHHSSTDDLFLELSTDYYITGSEFDTLSPGTKLQFEGFTLNSSDKCVICHQCLCQCQLCQLTQFKSNYDPINSYNIISDSEEALFSDHSDDLLLLFGVFSSCMMSCNSDLSCICERCDKSSVNNRSPILHNKYLLSSSTPLKI